MRHKSSNLGFFMVAPHFLRNVFADTDIDMTVTQPLPENLEGDKLRLKQIMINIVHNAVKFTQRGSIKILAGFSPEESRLRVSVIDTGKGIAPDQLPSIYNMFKERQNSNWSATAAVNQSPDSLGVGLLICKKLVE